MIVENKCPECGSVDVEVDYGLPDELRYSCNECKYEWFEEIRV